MTQAIAFHLPQFHPIPENDEWWGNGFTEWTNVTKAAPLFPGHYQPHLPADLGFYDLRLPEARTAQSDLARQYGVSGFCYYHYWFHGKRILERPVNEMLNLGQPEFPFCLCWANESWSRRWDGLESQVLLEQRYSAEDDIAHIHSLFSAFRDRRYIHIDGRPLFLIYRANRLPHVASTLQRWRREAEIAGLPGLFLLRVESFHDETGDPRDLGFDAAVEFQPKWKDLDGLRLNRREWWRRRLLGTQEPAFFNSRIYRYEDVAGRAMKAKNPAYPYIRCVTPGWDNTARRKVDGIVLHDSTPGVYEKWLSYVVEAAQRDENWSFGDDRFVFINAWNEWAEGNHLEPCQQWGRAYLEATGRVLRQPHKELAES